MKKVSLLIALALIVTIGGVYATWTYTQNTDVADEPLNLAMNLTGVAYSGSYGVYRIEKSSDFTMLIDPAEGTVHDTALTITGSLTVHFTPATFAPEDIKENGVDSTFQFTLSNSDWKYENQAVVTLQHTGTHDITWVKQSDGTFTYTLDAEALAEHIKLTTFTLDTKADYDAFSAVLANGQITFTVSDGVTSSTPSN